MLDKKKLTEEEINTAAREIIENLRKYQPAIYEIRIIMRKVDEMLDHVVLRKLE